MAAAAAAPGTAGDYFEAGNTQGDEDDEGFKVDNILVDVSVRSTSFSLSVV